MWTLVPEALKLGDRNETLHPRLWVSLLDHVAHNIRASTILADDFNAATYTITGLARIRIPRTLKQAPIKFTSLRDTKSPSLDESSLRDSRLGAERPTLNLQKLRVCMSAY